MTQEQIRSLQPVPPSGAVRTFGVLLALVLYAWLLFRVQRLMPVLERFGEIYIGFSTMLPSEVVSVMQGHRWLVKSSAMLVWGIPATVSALLIMFLLVRPRALWKTRWIVAVILLGAGHFYVSRLYTLPYENMAKSFFDLPGVPRVSQQMKSIEVLRDSGRPNEERLIASRELIALGNLRFADPSLDLSPARAGLIEFLRDDTSPIVLRFNATKALSYMDQLDYRTKTAEAAEAISRSFLLMLEDPDPEWRYTIRQHLFYLRGMDMAALQRAIQARDASNGTTPAVDSPPEVSFGAGAPPIAKVPFDSSAATDYQRKWANALVRLIEIKNSIGMSFIFIPPGEFSMGAEDAAVPVHTVRISRPYYLGKHEVKASEFQNVMGRNPNSQSRSSTPREDEANYPAAEVSWDEAVEFCEKLTRTERANGILDDKSEYRLPTEAEWEFACRAGTTTTFSFGDEFNSKFAVCGVGAQVNRYPFGAVNPFGLYNMHGNLAEWCHDFYGPYASGEARDPQGPKSGTARVYRGGGWDTNDLGCRSAFRYRLNPTFKDPGLGFRVCLTISPEVKKKP